MPGTLPRSYLNDKSVRARKLRREFTNVKSRFGNVTVKLGKLNGQVVQAAPESESRRKLAEQKKVPAKQVYEAVLKALSS